MLDCDELEITGQLRASPSRIGARPKSDRHAARAGAVHVEWSERAT